MTPYCYVSIVKNKWTDRRGYYHRLDGPAVEYEDGRKEWYKNGFLHRIGGPAIEGADGISLWYENGKMHRDDGPAQSSSFLKKNGFRNYWFLFGSQVSSEKFEEYHINMYWKS